MTDPPFRLEFTPSAMRDLEEISLLFPERSPRFDDIAAGLRMTGFERRATIADLGDENAKRVVIIGVFARGRDVGAALRNRGAG